MLVLFAVKEILDMKRTDRLVSLGLAWLLCVSFVAGLAMIPSGSEAADLPDDATIEGWVTSEGPIPVEDAYVKVMLMVGEGIQVNYSFTDSSGYYNINLTGGYDYAVFVAHEDYYFAMSQTSVQSGETVQRDFMLEDISPIETTVLIKGFVLDEADDPVTDGNVFAFASDPSGSDGMPYFGNLTTADIDGYFEVHVIPSTTGGGVYLMDLESSVSMVGNDTTDSLEDGLSYWMNITVTAPVFDDDAHLYGYVTDSTTSSPISGVMISADIYDEMADERYFNYTVTDASGYFDINVSSGSMDIQFQKSGYTIYMDWDYMVETGDDRDMSVELLPTVATIRGNLTDATTDDPLSYGNVILHDGAHLVTSTMSNETGFYELRAFEGSNLRLFTEVQGYSMGYEYIDVSSDDELWYDFALISVSAWLEGTVTDSLTGLPVENAWVEANSDLYYDECETDATGYYNISLVPGDYTVRVNAMDYRYLSVDDITIVDGMTVVQDFALIPWDLPETTLLSGYVTDADTLDPIENAQVRMALPDYSEQNSTYTDASGYYEMWVPPLNGMPIGVTAHMYAPSFDTLDCSGLSSLILDFQLVPDTYAPNVTYEQSPLTNVSWTNPMTIDAEAEDQNMKQIILFNFMLWYSEGGFDYLYIIEGASVSFDPFDPSSGLQYDLDGDNYTVQDEFNGTIDDSSVIGGWLDDGNGVRYLTASKQWWGPEMMYAFRGYYSNDTFDNMTGTAYFDAETGEYLMFYFDWGFEEAYPDDVAATFEPRVSTFSIEESDPSNFVWLGEEGLGPSSVTALTFTPDPMVPSGDYAMLFGVSDFGNNYDPNLWIVTPYAVDNDPPIADGGGDQYAVIDSTWTFDGIDSWDNVGIVNYTWEFEDDSVPIIRYGVSFDYTFTVLGTYAVILTVTDGAGHQDNDVFVITVTPDAIPVANAGVDFAVDEDDPATFDGTDSSDDLGIENYTWTILSLDVTMYGPTPSYTFADPGAYSVELLVNDTIGQTSEPDTVIVTVDDVTDPFADAGSDETVSFGTEVTLDGSGSSDNSGTIESYVWTFIDDGSVVLTGETVDYEFTAPGVYTVTLTVADAAGLEDIDTVVITVVDDEPPVADAGPDPTGVEAGDTVTLDGSDSSDNVGIVEYVWTFTDGTAQELTGETVDYTFEDEGEFTITLTVTDAAGFSDTDIVVVLVSIANDPPVADAGEDQNVKVDATVTLDASGSTDDNAIVTYTWTFDYDGEPVILTGVEQEFVFEIAGTYNVTLTVTDAQGLSDTDTVEIVVESSAMSFIADYWWAFAVIAAAVVIGVAAALMGRGKGGKGKASPPTENEIADEFDDDDLPPPDDEL